MVSQSIESLLSGNWNASSLRWLPEQPPGCFLADPFGWQQGSMLHVFAEALDYRTRHGTIERFTFDADGQLQERRPALREPWHLSYPAVFAADGAMWMLPEAFRSGALTLYRGDDALDHWHAECRIELDSVPVDATPFLHEGRWWLFYSPARVKPQRLHVAWAERLTGPWHPHALNPVRIDAAGARPGGLATLVGGRLMLPVQDCTHTYGGAVRPLWIDRLDEQNFDASLGNALPLPQEAGLYRDGMHTLSACGSWTLFDVKYVDRSGRGWLYDLQRWLRSSA